MNVYGVFHIFPFISIFNLLFRLGLMSRGTVFPGVVNWFGFYLFSDKRCHFSFFLGEFMVACEGYEWEYYKCAHFLIL